MADGARGLLRLDQAGLELLIEGESTSRRVPATRIGRVAEVRKGKFPAEYVARVEAARKAAKGAAAGARVVGALSGNQWLKMGAKLAAAGARATAVNTTLGEPFLNRLIFQADLGSGPTTLVFDAAGGDRDAAQTAAAAFHVRLAALASAPALPDAPPAAEERRVRLVGCPQCRATLRDPGSPFARCPRCSAKIRLTAGG